MRNRTLVLDPKTYGVAQEGLNLVVEVAKYTAAADDTDTIVLINATLMAACSQALTEIKSGMFLGSQACELADLSGACTPLMFRSIGSDFSQLNSPDRKLSLSDAIAHAVESIKCQTRPIYWLSGVDVPASKAEIAVLVQGIMPNLHGELHVVWAPTSLYDESRRGKLEEGYAELSTALADACAAAQVDNRVLLGLATPKVVDLASDFAKGYVLDVATSSASDVVKELIKTVSTTIHE